MESGDGMRWRWVHMGDEDVETGNGALDSSHIKHFLVRCAGECLEFN